MTGAPEAAGLAPGPAPSKDGEPTAAALRGRLVGALPALRHLPLAGLLAFSAVLNTHRLSQNGYANIFYSAGVKSMLHSWHNFLFVSFDPGGLITIDKPPFALWVQAISAKLFGFSPLSLLLPEAIAGVLSVAVLYVLLSRRLGPLAGLAGGLTLAVFPSFVAVSRENGVDPVLLLLMILACGAVLWAIRDGRTLPLLLCALLVGIAFNTKTLAAYLVVPGIATAYFACAPTSLKTRTLQLLAAGAVLLVISGAWIAFVELTPASQRPFIGSSTNNTELGLTFEYNGVGRVGGQVGGPGRTPAGTGALVGAGPPAGGSRHATHSTAHSGVSRVTAQRARHAKPAHASAAARKRGTSGGLFTALLPNGREQNPIAFGGATGPLRLFGSHLGDQDSWMLAFALFSLLAVALGMIRRRRPSDQAGRPVADGPPLRRDPRLALTVVFGGWLLVEAVVLSLSKGIVHPYYVSALAPGTGALAGIGVVVLTEFARRRPRDPRVLLLVPAVAATILAQVLVLHREHYMLWWVPILVAGPALGTLVAMSVGRLAPYAVAVTFLLLLVAPARYATTTWLAPVEGTFPSAGPKQAIGDGGVGVNGTDLRVDRSLLSYVSTHHPGSRWAVLTDASETAAPLILLGLDAGALAGYSGTDPALDGPGLARLVARHEARYVVLGGDYSSRGGNRATLAVLHACRRLPHTLWGGSPPHYESLVLFDCAGRERALAAS